MLSFAEFCHPSWKAWLAGIVLCLALSNSEALSEYRTCCAIQKACDGCSSVYKVNSITYCCPGCQGSVLVTALRCTCTVVVDDLLFTPNCTVSNKIIGDYYYGRTSWYSAASYPSVSASLLLLALCLSQMIGRWSGR